VERNALFSNIISSQARCIPPTKSFDGYTGYGCFAYIPLLWFEDQRVMDVETFYRKYDHFYSRPSKLVACACMVVGRMCLLVVDVVMIVTT
jgi:hypothetical protein